MKHITLINRKNTKIVSLLMVILLSTCIFCSCGSSDEDLYDIPSDATEREAEVLNYANDYLFSLGGFSEASLANQLNFEGFSQEEVEYALNNVDVDWNEQCLICAKDFLNGTSFSIDDLGEMLANEGFTEEQIEYALENIES